MAEQLTFDLPARESRARGDFFVSEANGLAVTRLENTDQWPNGKLVLVGPAGSGKTHLGHVWAEAENAVFEDQAPEAGALPERALALEVPETLTREEEEALFHLHNHMQSQSLPLLLIARLPPARWQIVLPDLKSRMEATDIVRIDPPDDALLAAVMVKQFADRQLVVAPQVIDWLLAHMDRSFADARRVVDALDRAALTEGRAITRPFAQRALAPSPD